jgi:cytidylate kinase
MKAIIICGWSATGKTTVAKIISEKLGIKLLSGSEILMSMAKEKGYSPNGDDWWDTEQGMKFLAERTKNFDFDKEVDRRLIKEAEKGNVVMTSYTLPFISKEGIKIWLDASEKNRAMRMSHRDRITFEAASKVLKARDKENGELYLKMYDIRFGKDFSPFDMVIDANSATAEEIASLIMEYAKKAFA